MIFRRKITEKRVSYLTDTIAEIVAKYKKEKMLSVFIFIVIEIILLN